MTEKDSDQFKIRLDDDLEDDDLEKKHPDEKENIEAAEDGDGKTKPPGQRVIVLIIIIIGLLGVLFTFAYVDVKRRIDIIQASGSSQVINLSQDLRTKLSDLSTQSDAVSELAKNEIAALKKEVDAMSDTLEKINRDVKRSEESGKSKLEAAITPLQKKISTLQKDTRSIDTRFTEINDMVKREVTKLDDIINGLQKDLEAVKTDISLFEKKQVEQEKARLALEIQQKRVDKDLDQIQKYIENRFSTLEKRIQAVESGKVVSAAPVSPRPAPTPAPTSTPQPSEATGDITEQDISE